MNEKSKTSCDLLDSDGENQAVRVFLNMYAGGNEPSSEKMRLHLTRRGFEGCWPDWANNANNNGYLSAAMAQSWIRHLFALEWDACPARDEREAFEWAVRSNKIALGLPLSWQSMCERFAREGVERYLHGSLDAAWRAWQARAALSSLPDAPPPKLTLALPDYEQRQIVIVSDDLVDGERIVCVAIKDAAAPAQPSASDISRATAAGYSNGLETGRALALDEMQEKSFQDRVQPWMMACFGAEISSDKSERNHRFLEEALELVQACGATQAEAHQLVDYVYGRPDGEVYQEVGGVMVTLAALCLAQGVDMHESGETELARICEPSMVEKIRAKQAAKPKNSPLPITQPAQDHIADSGHMVQDAPVAWFEAEKNAAGLDLRAVIGVMSAVENLIKVKGRHHTEQAYQRLAKAFDVARALGIPDKAKP